MMEGLCVSTAAARLAKSVSATLALLLKSLSVYPPVIQRFCLP